MAQTLPLNFPIPAGEQSLISYSFSEGVSKTAYITFYVVADSTGSKFLSSTDIHSDEGYTNTQKGENTTGSEEYNIDIEIKSPIIAKGRAFVSATCYAQRASAGTGNGYFKIRLYKYDGSTETEIGAQVTTQTATSSSSTYDDVRVLASFDVARTHFAIGDIFRLNIEFWWDNTGTGGSKSGWFHDGKNRDFTGRTNLGEATPTNVIVNLPLEVQT